MLWKRQHSFRQFRRGLAAHQSFKLGNRPAHRGNIELARHLVDTHRRCDDSGDAFYEMTRSCSAPRELVVIDPAKGDFVLGGASGFPGEGEQVRPAALIFAFFVNNHAEGGIGCVGLLVAAHELLFGLMSMRVHSFEDIPRVGVDYHHQLKTWGQISVAQNSM